VLYLATSSGPAVGDAIAAGQLGQMLTHTAQNRLVPGARFAVDAGTVRIAGHVPVSDPGWRPDRWAAYIERHAGAPGCLFAVVPDVVCDAAGTDARWRQYAPAVLELGYRPAYVLQNGCRAIPGDAGAVFVGGDTAFKLGHDARRLVDLAHTRGLWVHWGRVNTLRRLRLAALAGAHSVDGTTLAYGPHRNLPQLLGWLSPAQPALFGGIA
jgi:hypothetical protein